MMYKVTNRRSHEAWLVKAAGHQEAAQIAAGSRRITMVRVTGEDGMSGIYQGYLEMPAGGQSSSGDQYHVTLE